MVGSERNTSVHRHHTEKRVVLLIENDSTQLYSMAGLLRSVGFEVCTAGSREEALESIEKDGVRPDLIVSESELGVAEILSQLPFRPLTLLLASTPSWRSRIWQSPVDRVLTKPVNRHVLLNEVGCLLGSVAHRAVGLPN